MSGKPNFGYKTTAVCDVCGKVKNNQIEPRFGYVVCEDHQDISPIYIIRKLGGVQNPSDTPETDSKEFYESEYLVEADFARKLERQRNELLEALKFVMSAHGEQLDWAFQKAQEAIAKVEGGTA